MENFIFFAVNSSMNTISFRTVMPCTIWQHLYNFKKVKNTHGGVLLLVKLLAEVCNFTKSNTPTWVIFTFFKLHKGYQIVQSITYPEKSSKSDRLFWERKINYTVKTPDQHTMNISRILIIRINPLTQLFPYTIHMPLSTSLLGHW